MIYVDGYWRLIGYWVFLREGYAFGKAGDGFERVNLAVPTKYLEKMLERLYEVLKVEFPKFCK